MFCNDIVDLSFKRLTLYIAMFNTMYIAKSLSNIAETYKKFYPF